MYILVKKQQAVSVTEATFIIYRDVGQWATEALFLLIFILPCSSKKE